MIETGTRKRNNMLHNAPPQGTITRSLSTDQGLTKKFAASGSLHFNSGAGNITGNVGQFTNILVGDLVQVEGTNLNNGFFTCTGTVANHSTITVSPSPNDENIAGSSTFGRVP